MHYSIQMEKKQFFCLELLPRFQLDSYKEELGKLYSQILYLCSTSEFDNVSCDAIELNQDPKLSLPGIVTNDFDKIYESEMPAVDDDQEQEPNIPVTNLENEVFDLDSYSYNHTLVTSNVLQLAILVVKI